jgi:tRNA-specific 2-thiouridylase
MREEVLSERCTVDDVQWISGKPPADGTASSVKLRYRHKGAPAKIRLLEPGRMEVIFDEEQFAVTPGQAAVVYDGDEVLGGGWIA